MSGSGESGCGWMREQGEGEQSLKRLQRRLHRCRSMGVLSVASGSGSGGRWKGESLVRMGGRDDHGGYAW